ncbi:ATP phosphoribosyltransferase [Candidatus Micrarchaeota archaeon CG08_land_8_20_14_0_20_49_17]|nr:MAG: ATP phosphoribosyltransferase [Candidatus Micrarchaeota archaeon CG1_02_49_24]PIU09553.1 MAG: ATP phosphoribosyltransferase [Candidatus Micrarchaeota archaeon CG08_land_8_20_14_0_20_49_17]PIU82605.1 MAG: ATP phosphoribosyltransferase [Candidatus Micrarchaeota archaeon CG06_land_8_20_14_3_00_50_6]HII53544.1 ATP phosphoribosyltransferase [Candidatus Micrarchaeota archaeon]
MLKIALPNKGRLCEPALKLMSQAGIDISEVEERKLVALSSDGHYMFLFLRTEDIPKIVERGACDLGITGSDLVEETGANVIIISNLSFGYCRVVLAAKRKLLPRELEGKTIATKLPNIAKKYFSGKKVNIKLLLVAGACEAMPSLGIADAIVDQVSTGTTLLMNDMYEVDTIFESSACLIANKASMLRKKEEIEILQLGIDGIMLASRRKYLMLNVGADRLEIVLRVLPSMKSPTLLKLASGDYAVHSVVEDTGLNHLIARLKRAGARDILLVDIERIVK